LAEIKALKAKVRRLEEDNAILKVATIFLREQGCQVAAGPPGVSFGGPVLASGCQTASRTASTTRASVTVRAATRRPGCRHDR
jgi:hypothetical protein